MNTILASLIVIAAVVAMIYPFTRRAQAAVLVRLEKRLANQSRKRKTG